MKRLLVRAGLILLLSLSALLESGLVADGNSVAAPRPNIIVMMSDDMGYSDIGCYGGEINTPNLNLLAGGGDRFTQFYNTARCCPTRAALMTGLYSHQTGVGHMMNDRGHDGYRGDLNQECVTIAEALKPAGYSTYMTGKWHVTPYLRPKNEAEKHNWPLQRGFERYYGTISGAGSFYDPYALVRDNELISPYNDSDYKPPSYYYTDAISDNAVRYLADHHRQKADKPFFLYVAYTAAHWPMHALEKDLAKYRGKYDGGYEPIRRARFERMKKLGLLDARWQMSPQAGDWNAVADKAWEARGMEVYAAMIDNMDQGIGRILAQLKKDGQLDNTLIFFLQDNGGCAEVNGRTVREGVAATRAEKPSLPPMPKEAIQYDQVPKQTRDGIPFAVGPQVMPGPDGTFIAYGKNWANVSNTPFREYKHWVHEGGISTPLIAHWPKGIPAARRNKLIQTPGHLIDIMATCIDVSGANYPKQFNGHQITPLEGVSLAPALAGKPLARSQPIFWEHEGNRAVREGNWKLVAQENQPWELYDVAADRTEMNNLAAKHTDKVKALSAKWDAWAARAKVLPLGAWRATR